MIKWETLKTAEDMLAETVAGHCQWLNTERDRLIAAGIEHGGYRYQTGDRNIADLMGALQVSQVAQATGQQFTTQWLTEDNQTVTLGVAELAALGVAVAEHKAALVYKCREHKNALLAMTTQAEVDTYLTNMEW